MAAVFAIFLVGLPSDAFAVAAWADCSQSLYVANEGNGGGGTTIIRADCNGNITNFAGGFTGTSGLVTDGTYFYVTDDSPGMWRVDSTGAKTAIAVGASFTNPNGLAIDSSGRFLVADAGSRLLRLTLDAGGNLVSEEVLATDFPTPQGVVETSGSDILFTDQDGYIYRITGATSTPIAYPAVAQREPAGQIVQGNQGSIKLDASGNMYTANFSGRIVRVDPTGADARDVVDIPATACPAGQAGNNEPSFRGFTFTPDGDLVATGYCLDNVYIFSMTAINNAYATNTPITALPAPFIENPSSALDGPYLNGPFGLAFYGSDVPPLWEACTTPAEQDNVIYVDVNGPAGSPDGSPGAPYLTIQDGVNNASPGDIIKVQPGVYGENVTISTDDIHLVAQGPATAVVNAGSTFDGITITQFVEGVSIANFRFTGAISAGVGSYAGIIIYGSSPDPRGLEICNNVFMDNELGVAAQNATSPVIVNNDFVNNTDAGVSTGAGSTAIIRNNLFQGNADGIRSDSASVTIDYNLFFNNAQDFGGTATCDVADGCVFGSDPLLASVAGNDYHLTTGSPAIDTATGVLAPATDFDVDSRPLDGDGDSTATTDIGADEVTTQAATPTPTPQPTATATPSGTATPTATPVPAAVPGVSGPGLAIMVGFFLVALFWIVRRSEWTTDASDRQRNA